MTAVRRSIVFFEIMKTMRRLGNPVSISFRFHTEIHIVCSISQIDEINVSTSIIEKHFFCYVLATWDSETLSKVFSQNAVIV